MLKPIHLYPFVGVALVIITVVIARSFYHPDVGDMIRQAKTTICINRLLECTNKCGLRASSAPNSYSDTTNIHRGAPSHAQRAASRPMSSMIWKKQCLELQPWQWM